MSKKKIIAVDEETHRALKAQAAIQGKQMKEYIADLVEADAKKATPTATKKDK